MNPLWKKLGIAIFTIVLLSVGIFYFTQSKEKEVRAAFVNPAFGEYISTYTAGIVSAKATIRLVLAQPIADSADYGQELSAKVFDFSPSIKGKAYWLDSRTIEFRPTSSMQSGQLYDVQFFLSKLLDTPEDLQTFTYTFQVVAQNFEVSIDNQRPYIKTDLKQQKIEGTLFTADQAEHEAVEKVLTATQTNKRLSISWTHAGDGKQHAFVIENVVRGDEASNVSLTTNGESLSVKKEESLTIEVPSLSDFKLMTAKVVQSPSQYVVLQFSDPLKEKQNLEGLIRISDVESMEFDIHDNEIWVYPPVRQTGTKTVYVEEGIRNILDYRMRTATSKEVVFEQVSPAVRFTGKGTILPSSNGLVLPFEAVNLRSVEVQITKIFENNMLQFLQTNAVDGSSEMRRVGKRMIKKVIALDNMGVTDLGKWNRYTLNLAELITTEPGGIYQVKISFKKAHSVYNCDVEETGEEEAEQFAVTEQDENSYDDGYNDYYDEEYYYDEYYDWNERDNPCHASYYNAGRSIRKNILASDLGITAKGGDDGNTTIFVTDLKSTEPLGNVQVTLYDYQQQIIGEAASDASGKCIIKSNIKPFALIAKNGAQRGYLKVNDGDALSLSSFDVSGEVVQNGLKGFLYGERGVWRPGDSLYLTFLLEDKSNLLPPAHPVVFELVNPQGQVVNRLVRSSSENGFYKFATLTAPEAPTGNWMARVKVGGSEFNQPLKIETIKPNRLKINLDFGKESFTATEVSGQLDVKWLHGAPGRKLKATFDVTLVSVPTTFAKYPDFIFEDPSREFYSETQQVFEGATDEEGRASVNVTLETSTAAPGFLHAIFRGKVFEESGNFSIDRFTIPYYPYQTYVGVKVPEGEKYSGILYLDKEHTLEIASLNQQGIGVSRSGLEVSVYKLNWRWWWDNSDDRIANYVEGSNSQLIKSEKINTINGKGRFQFKIDSPEWGRYFVRVCDPISGHCTGKVIYVDESGWASRSRNDESSEGATLLSFSSDKGAYNIQEDVTLTIPGSANGRALVSVENGSKVLETYWVQTQVGETKFSFKARPEMAPNVYVHVSLLQPHAQTVNDLPIRLYGVIPIKVEDPRTHLEPIISMPEVLEPGKKVTIKISEKNDRSMTYTVAVVDEGLLDLTRFKTPDPWNRFYAREALGVRTWDVFDQVLGSFGTHIERLISIGGDMELAAAKEDDVRANRFKPVVKYLGPFTLGKGDTDEHTFIMPEYIGSVKTMVVAGYQAAYGKTEKVTPVHKPLMVLATLPRVLGPQEKVKLPITLFTQEKGIKSVKVDVKVTGPISIEGATTQTVGIGASGDLTLDFDLIVKGEVGVATVEVMASTGKYSAIDKIEIEVRNPNTPIVRIDQAILEVGKSWSHEVVPFGISGTNTTMLEVSSMPPVNLGSRLRYLMQYPHGCIEQTTSAVFPQLYLEQVKALTEAEKNAIQRNVTAGINRLKSFVQRDGGFGYWPGTAENSDAWGTSYGGHFLLDAEAKGYFVPADMLKRWKNYQKNKAQEWRRNDNYYNSELIQVYRLYTLALAGSPELGAMNRLREQGNLSSTAAWMLSATYAKAGQVEAAKKMVTNLSAIIKPYRELGYSYGSDVRDKAIILETLVGLNEREKAFELVKEISKSLSNDAYWMSTQEVAYSLKAIGAFAGKEKRGALKFSYSLGSKKISASTELPLAQVSVPLKGVDKERIQLTNESSGMIYVRVINEGTPARGEEKDEQSNLLLSVRYTTTDGLSLDPSTLKQGTEFIAEVSVQHTGSRSSFENLALAQIFPPGWEINNLRLQDAEQALQTSAFTYQDLRDDRVYTYFDLKRNERKVFRILLTASYAGTFYLPAVTCTAMYDNAIYARIRGNEVKVQKQ